MNRTALVTGASGGIGRAISLRLHAAGAHVILSGRNVDALNALAAELNAMPESPGTTIAVADLGNKESIDAMLAEHGKAIDILINNAGMTNDTLLMRMKDEQWQEVMDVDLTSVMRLSRGVLRTMIKQRFGRIISITSVVGSTGNAGQSSYAAAKAGIVGFTKSVAAEVAERNITVNCVAPGFIATKMTDVLPDAVKQNILTSIPMGRMGNPDDVASGVAFLASEEASYITGHTLHINGGMARHA